MYTYNKKTGHDFSDFLSPSQTWDLVKFLHEGQAPIEDVIASQGQANGNIPQGKISIRHTAPPAMQMTGTI